MGRAAIAMAAVRLGTCAEPGKITGHRDLRPPTDVMVITSLPARRSREGTRWQGDKGARGDGIRKGAATSVGITLYKKENNLLKPYI